MNNGLELYIHLPFCARKCEYCDFLSFAAPERVQRQYMEQLIAEMEGQSACAVGRRVDTVFLGGGTPSLLPAGMMEELLAVLWECFEIAKDAEITIEANPGTLTMEKLEVYRAGGVNRLSLGLQSANDAELKALGRIHSYDEFLKSYQRAREAGFTNINVDLMSGLPGQDVHSWKQTLRKVAMLRPEHISAYSLILEEGTPFYSRYAEQEKRLRAGKDPRGAGSAQLYLPDEDSEREMYYTTKKFLAAQGYERYEISNYARKGMKCRHNIGYWTGVDYLGLGLGASSCFNGSRFHNTEDLKEYLSLNLHQPGIAAREIHTLTLTERMEEFMFLGLRMMCGVSGSEFANRFGQNMWNVYKDVIPNLQAQGLLEVEMPWVRLSERGIDVSNMVLAEFLLDEG